MVWAKRKAHLDMTTMVRYTLELDPTLYDDLREMERESDNHMGQILRNGLIMLKYAREAVAQGKRFGIVSGANQLETEFVGF